MFNEKQRFSLRKLSVGLASVCIGLSFVNMTSKEVKADTVSVQTSVAEPQNNLLDDLGKQKASTENNQAEAKNQENRLVDQINYKLTNNTSTDNKEDLGQNLTAPDETKQAPTTKSDAEKSIVGSSSTQQVNNQSNNRAEDNAQEQPQNNKRLVKKMLAVNLTENQAINDSTDPSQIDPSHFADGTHWTTAGWTRTDKNTKVAKKSSLVISDWGDGHNDSTPWRQLVTQNTSYYLQDLNFTIDKNDIKKGNKILIATVQNLPTNTKQIIDGSQLFMYNWYLTDKYNINYQNKTIGNITASQLDKDEIDLYFNLTTTLNNLNNLASDPTFNIHLGKPISVDNMDRKDYAKYRTNFPYNYCIVTNHNIREYDTYIANTTNALPKNTVDQWYNWSRYNSSYGWSGLAITNSEHQLTGDKNINDADYIVKIQSINNSNVDPRFIRINTTTYFSVIDANGNPTDEINELYDSDDKNGLKQAQDNLSSIDLWNATPTGYSYYSKQHDGSILLCIKQRPNINSINQINQNSLRNWADGSYLANVQDPDHKQQIIDNTVNKTKGWVAYTSDFKLGSYGIYQITDVTPSNYSKHTNLGTTTVEFLDRNSNMPSVPSGSADLETYKNVKISYIDDDATDSTKSDISSDSMTGRQNKASTYTVNIPKGYYLDDNNTSTGYTWNTDHTAISYTFNEDQAKNNANPIEIHLKHKIQDVSATDPNAKQTNTYKVIENLPDGTQKKIAELDITSHRSATKDMVTGNVTYGNWDTNKAEVSTGAGDDRIIAAIDAVPGYTYVNIPRFESIEKDNNGHYVIGFWIDENNNANIDFIFGDHKTSGITYKSMPASQTFYINYTPNKQTVNYIFYDDTSNKQLDDTKTSYTGVTDGSTNVSLTLPTNYVLSDGQTLPTSYMFKASNPDVLIHVKHATRVSKDLDHADPATRRIVVYMPDNSTLTYLQTLNYVRDVILDLVTNTTTYGTKYNFDANTSSVALDAPGNLKAQYASSLPAKAYMQTSSGNVYLDKDGYAYFSSIKLPKLPGYKAHLIKDPVNPTAFLVSFMAVPEQLQNNQSASNNDQSSQKEAQAKQKQLEPIQTKPADDKQVDQLVRTISYTLMHNDSSDTADSFEPAQTDSAPLETADVTQKVKPKPAKPAPIETQVPVGTHDSLSNYTLTTNDSNPDTRVFNNIESNELTWQIINKNLNNNVSYNLTNTIYKLRLPKFTNYSLHLVKRGTTRNSISFVYTNKSMQLNYVFNLKIQDNKYYLTVGKIDRATRKILPIKTYNVISYQDLLDNLLNYFK